MNIRFAHIVDFEVLKKYDRHIDPETLMSKIESSTIIVVHHENEFVGWLRYNFFWDEHPFMNMLFILDEYRGKGYGSALTSYWEDMMKERGHSMVMLSTMANETSQLFYRSKGYKDVGGFVLEDEPMELIMIKKL